MSNNQPLFGLPYVGWSARPAKNGQPPPCVGQCNINIGTRKVGAAMKRLPQIYMGPKAKEQILQKWDPTSKSIRTIYPCIPATSVNPDPLTITSFTLQYYDESAAELNIAWTNNLPNGSNPSITITIYETPLFSSTTGGNNSAVLDDSANITDISYASNIPVQYNYYYFARLVLDSNTFYSNVVRYVPLNLEITSFTISSFDSINGSTVIINWNDLLGGNGSDKPDVIFRIYSSTDNYEAPLYTSGPINIREGSFVLDGFTGGNVFEYLIGELTSLDHPFRSDPVQLISSTLPLSITGFTISPYDSNNPSEFVVSWINQLTDTNPHTVTYSLYESPTSDIYYSGVQVLQTSINTITATDSDISDGNNILSYTGTPAFYYYARLEVHGIAFNSPITQLLPAVPVVTSVTAQAYSSIVSFPRYIPMYLSVHWTLSTSSAVMVTLYTITFGILSVRSVKMVAAGILMESFNAADGLIPYIYYIVGVIPTQSGSVEARSQPVLALF